MKYFVFQMELEFSKTGCVSVPMAQSCLFSWAYYKYLIAVSCSLVLRLALLDGSS